MRLFKPVFFIFTRIIKYLEVKETHEVKLFILFFVCFLPEKEEKTKWKK